MPEISKEQLIVIVIAIMIVMSVAIYRGNSPKTIITKSSPDRPVKVEKPLNSVSIPQSTSKNSIIVHISGAVAHPGVYKMKASDRMIDLIRLAGASERADLDSINLAETLSDGKRIILPVRRALITAPAGTETASGPLNINSATLSQLDALPGIGQVTAKKLIAYRDKNGSFSSIDDVKKAGGISAKKFDALKELITVQ